MASARVIGSSRTSAHPAVRKTVSRMEGTATTGAMASAIATAIATHPGLRELTLRLVGCRGVNIARRLTVAVTSLVFGLRTWLRVNVANQCAARVLSTERLQAKRVLPRNI